MTHPYMKFMWRCGGSNLVLYVILAAYYGLVLINTFTSAKISTIPLKLFYDKFLQRVRSSVLIISIMDNSAHRCKLFSFPNLKFTQLCHHLISAKRNRNHAFYYNIISIHEKRSCEGKIGDSVEDFKIHEINYVEIWFRFFSWFFFF